MPEMLGIKAGTLNDSSAYVPMLDFHVDSAAPWDSMNPELPKKQGAAHLLTQRLLFQPGILMACWSGNYRLLAG